MCPAGTPPALLPLQARTEQGTTEGGEGGQGRGKHSRSDLGGNLVSTVPAALRKSRDPAVSHGRGCRATGEQSSARCCVSVCTFGSASMHLEKH